MMWAYDGDVLRTMLVEVAHARGSRGQGHATKACRKYGSQKFDSTGLRSAITSLVAPFSSGHSYNPISMSRDALLGSLAL